MGGGICFLFPVHQYCICFTFLCVTHHESLTAADPEVWLWGKQLTANNRPSLHAPPLRSNALLSSSLTSSSHPTRCRRRPRWHCAPFKQRQALIYLLYNSLTQNQQKPFSFPTLSNATFRDCTCHVCLRARIACAPSSGADAATKCTCSP